MRLALVECQLLFYRSILELLIVRVSNLAHFLHDFLNTCTTAPAVHLSVLQRGEQMGKQDIFFTLLPIRRSKYTEIVLRQTGDPQIQVEKKGAIQHIEDIMRVFDAVHTICHAIL